MIPRFVDLSPQSSAGLPVPADCPTPSPSQRTEPAQRLGVGHLNRTGPTGSAFFAGLQQADARLAEVEQLHTSRDDWMKAALSERKAHQQTTAKLDALRDENAELRIRVGELTTAAAEARAETAAVRRELKAAWG